MSALNIKIFMQSKYNYIKLLNNHNLANNVRMLNARTKNRLKNVGFVVGIIQVVLKSVFLIIPAEPVSIIKK